MLSTALYSGHVHCFLLGGRAEYISESLHNIWALVDQTTFFMPHQDVFEMDLRGQCAASLSGLVVQIHVPHPQRWRSHASQEQEVVLGHNNRGWIGGGSQATVWRKHVMVLINKSAFDALQVNSEKKSWAVLFLGLHLISGLEDFWTFAKGISRDCISSCSLKPLQNTFWLAWTLETSLSMATLWTWKTYIPGSSKLSLVPKRNSMEECPDTQKLLFYLQASKNTLAGNPGPGGDWDSTKLIVHLGCILTACRSWSGRQNPLVNRAPQTPDRFCQPSKFEKTIMNFKDFWTNCERFKGFSICVSSLEHYMIDLETKLPKNHEF